MGLAKGTYHKSWYMKGELEIEDVATLDVSDHDTFTLLVRGSRFEVFPTGWKVPLPLNISERDGDHLAQFDLRGIDSIDISVDVPAHIEYFGGLGGLNF